VVPNAARRIDDLGCPELHLVAKLKESNVAKIGREVSGGLDVSAISRPAEGRAQISHFPIKPPVGLDLPRAAPELKVHP
jgi:hypothetical protein